MKTFQDLTREQKAKVLLKTCHLAGLRYLNTTPERRNVYLRGTTALNSFAIGDRRFRWTPQINDPKV